MCLVIWFHMVISKLSVQILSLCFSVPQAILSHSPWTSLLSRLMSGTLLVGGLLRFSDQPLMCVLERHWRGVIQVGEYPLPELQPQRNPTRRDDLCGLLTAVACRRAAGRASWSHRLVHPGHRDGACLKDDVRVMCRALSGNKFLSPDCQGITGVGLLFLLRRR